MIVVMHIYDIDIDNISANDVASAIQIWRHLRSLGVFRCYNVPSANCFSLDSSFVLLSLSLSLMLLSRFCSAYIILFKSHCA